MPYSDGAYTLKSGYFADYFCQSMAEIQKNRIYLKEWRESHKQTQTDIEGGTGIDQSTLSDIENNPTKRRHSGTLKRLAAWFKVDVRELFFPPPEVTPEQIKIEKTSTLTPEEVLEHLGKVYAAGDLTTEQIMKRIVEAAEQRERQLKKKDNK